MRRPAGRGARALQRWDVFCMFGSSVCLVAAARLELLGLFGLLACAGSGRFIRFTRKSGANAAHTSVGLEFLGMICLSVCLMSGSVTRCVPISRGIAGHCSVGLDLVGMFGVS